MEQAQQKALTMEEKAEAAMKRLEEILAMPAIRKLVEEGLPDDEE